MKAAFIFILLACSAPSLIGQDIDNADTLKIGNEYQGGIVFYVDELGEHGLIAAPNDQTTEKIWWGPKGNTMALSPNDGQSNTKKIVAFYQSDKRGRSTAANLCDNLSLSGFSDWYLPAIDELVLLYNERKTVGNFLVGDYCSSTEMRKDDAYSVHFKPHKRVEFYYNKVDKDYYVRCIRKF